MKKETHDKAISVCICTRNRPEILRRCLTSIANGSVLPFEVIIGDDSHQPDETLAVCQEFAFARYLRGPQTGLCANRNSVIQASTGEYITLIDDDARLGVDFIERCQEIALGLDEKTILTGNLLEQGMYMLSPMNPDFLGFFNVKPHRVYKTVHLNCNLFPRTAFDIARFDEAIVYGYEDMDLCSHLLRHGFQIRHVPSLVNEHLPPPKQAGTYKRESDQARFYTSLKRYWFIENKPLLGLIYLPIALLHQMFHHIRLWHWHDVPNVIKDMRLAFRQVLPLLRSQ